MPFKQVFRLAFVTLIWKQYKPVIVSTLLLFGFLYLVGSLHADFLEHTKLEGQSDGVGRSFVYKWAALAGGVLAYFAYHYFRPRKKDQAKEKRKRITQELAQLSDSDDPFASIRARKNLRSRSDFIMEKDKK